MIISITGFMGCGKSSTGRALADELSWEFIDLDSYIEHKTGLGIEEIFSEGETAFRAIEAEALRDVVAMREVAGGDLVLALGGGTVTTPDCLRIVKQKTVCFWLETDFETILGRISGGSGRPLLKGMSDSEVEDLFERRKDLYRQVGQEIRTSGKTIRETAGMIYEKIR